jgi:hypothetical protein
VRINFDMLREILLHFKLEDLRELYWVCKFFWELAEPYLSYTTVCISDANPPDEFYEFCEANRKLMYPLLHQQVIFVDLAHPLEPFITQSRTLAIFTTNSQTLAIFIANNRSLNRIDTSQLRSIGYSSKKPTVDDTDLCYLERYDIFDFLNSYYQELPNVDALIMCNTELCLQGMQECKINPQLKSLNRVGSDIYFYSDPYGKSNYSGERCPFTSLQEFAITIEHNCCVNLSELDNLKKLIFHLAKPDSLILDVLISRAVHFNANQCELLNHWEVLCVSPTCICCFNFALPNTSCLLHTFICDAPPEHVSFTVYGTIDHDGVFIPGNNDWVSNLKKIKVHEDFYWLVEISEGVFVRYHFSNVTLQEDVIFEHYDMLFLIEVSPSYSAIEHNHIIKQQKKVKNYKKRLQKKNRKNLQQQQQKKVKNYNKKLQKKNRKKQQQQLQQQSKK